MITNPLLDQEFLNKLHNYKQRETYARITLLTQDELPIKYIEGRVTGGSINVDGASALRRTCNLTMVLFDQFEINQFDWTFKSKFKLEIGLKNTLQPQYPDIIWFKQGIFILTSCNMSQSINTYTINITGKDKMCLLNGDIAGNIMHATDFGKEEYLDTITGKLKTNDFLLKDIIRHLVQILGQEKPENIIINDLDEAGLELLEYRAENLPLYLFRHIDTGEVNQVTLNQEHRVWYSGCPEDGEVITSSNITYAPLSHLNWDVVNPTAIKLDPSESTYDYNILCLNYGDVAGYRFTDLTYNGELKGEVGDTLVSILDKIKNMLGLFEYFYNIDGKFVFQKKAIYVSTPWTANEKNAEDFVNQALNDSHVKINLTNSELVTQFSNNPNLLNVKNDFSVWGTYKSISGADIPIHMRYALDTKPYKYLPIRSIWKRRVDNQSDPPEEYIYYNNLGLLSNIVDDIDDNGNQILNSYFIKPFVTSDKDDGFYVDWRELIYQMSLDFTKLNQLDTFHIQIADKNPHYPLGITGYEQYYTDIEGFWRQIYNLNPEPDYVEIYVNDIKIQDDSDLLEDNIYMPEYYRPITQEEIDDDIYTLDQMYVIQTNQVTKNDGTSITKEVFQPFIGSTYCHLTKGTTYYRFNTWNESWAESDEEAFLNNWNLKDIYVAKSKDSKFCDIVYQNLDEKTNKIWVKSQNRIKFNDINEKCRHIFQGYVIAPANAQNNAAPLQQLVRWSLDDNFGNLSNHRETLEKLTYLRRDDTGGYDTNTGWNNSVITASSDLKFWFDFLETEGSSLYKYSVKAIGPRTKAVNDSNVKSIYYREVPDVIFISNLADRQYSRESGYTYIQLPGGYSSLFTISTQGKCAKEKIDELLQQHSFPAEQTNITTLPIYHLAPNMRISIKDDRSKIDGEYIITKFTIPLNYNGTMSLSTSKVVSNII